MIFLPLTCEVESMDSHIDLIEAAVFETFLNLTDGAHTSQASVEGCIDDTCNLTGPVFDTSNLTQLIRDNLRMIYSANQSGIRVSLNRLNIRSSWMTSAMVQSTGFVLKLTTVLHVFNVLSYSDPTVVCFVLL